jgi:hypothetical protein
VRFEKQGMEPREKDKKTLLVGGIRIRFIWQFHITLGLKRGRERPE